jgi:hypothetical protein
MKTMLLLLLSMMLTMSCYSVNYEYQEKTLVQLHNRGTNDLKVYLVHESGTIIRRIAFIEGNSERNIEVPTYDFNTNVIICAIPLAGSEKYCTDILRVMNDTYVGLFFEHQLSISSYGIFRFRKKKEL